MRYTIHHHRLFAIEQSQFQTSSFETCSLLPVNLLARRRLNPAVMPIPDYQTVMLPLLKSVSDGSEHSMRDIVNRIADEFEMTETERSQQIPSGTASTISNRVGWARTYLKQAGLLDMPRRAHVRITPEGKRVLANNPSRIDNTLLSRYESFRDFRSRAKNDETAVSAPTGSGSEETPAETMARAYQQLRAELEAEVLALVKSGTPQFFERVVVDLLVAMGYGGSRSDAGRAVGRSGDGGIDGIIKEDKLGLDVIYLQAKRWENVVGRPEIQKFAGALQGLRANKGVFITTSSFSRESIEYANVISSKIILLDGITLASLMVEHSVGVTSETSFVVKRVDSDYFESE